MVAAALVRVAGLHLFTHHHVDLHVLLLTQTQIEQFFVSSDEFHIALVLFQGPVVIGGVDSDVLLGVTSRCMSYISALIVVGSYFFGLGTALFLHNFSFLFLVDFWIF